MKKTVFLLLMLYLFGISANAQNNGDWQYMGKVSVYYDSGRGEYSYFDAKTAFMYAHFNGQTMDYKIYVPDEQESYNAYRNSDYSQSRYEWYQEQLNDDHFRGPHLKTKEKYSMRAGRYYFNPASVQN